MELTIGERLFYEGKVWRVVSLGRHASRGF